MRDEEKRDVRKEIEEHERQILEDASVREELMTEEEKERFLKRKGSMFSGEGSDGGSAADGGAA